MAQRVTSDDLIDLRRWAAIVFASEDIAGAAVNRYHRWAARQPAEPSRPWWVDPEPGEQGEQDGDRRASDGRPPKAA